MRKPLQMMAFTACPARQTPVILRALRASGIGLVLGLACCLRGFAAEAPPLRLVTLDPGHFHAALFQKEMLPGMDERVHVYAPLGPDLSAHLARIAQYNARTERPTSWRLEVHASPDFFERLLSDKPGNIVVISGRNRGKIERIEALIRAGFHVLADKPWVIESEDLPRLESALELAEARGLMAYDAMTQRFEITCLLRRALVNDPSVFGEAIAGTPEEPGVEMSSVHYLLKEVSGVTSLRPAWFFDVREQGEGLTDVGTHLVDLVHWTLFPEREIRVEQDLRVLNGSRWPVKLSLGEFEKVTGSKGYPEALRGSTVDGVLNYCANNTVLYRVFNTLVRLKLEWRFAEAGAKDSEVSVFRGTRSRIELRQGKEEGFVPQLRVVPDVAHRQEVFDGLERRVAALQAEYPGLSLRERGDGWELLIPESLREGHEAHFAKLTARFLNFVKGVEPVPRWERPNMMAKYFVTTRGVQYARNHPTQP